MIEDMFASTYLYDQLAVYSYYYICKFKGNLHLLLNGYQIVSFWSSSDWSSSDCSMVWVQNQLAHKEK